MQLVHAYGMCVYLRNQTLYLFVDREDSSTSTKLQNAMLVSTLPLGPLLYGHIFVYNQILMSIYYVKLKTIPPLSVTLAV